MQTKNTEKGALLVTHGIDTLGNGPVRVPMLWRLAYARTNAKAMERKGTLLSGKVIGKEKEQRFATGAYCTERSCLIIL